jgi:hypothetical protein
MIATLTGRCPLCGGRILRNRSRIERTLEGWAHEDCASTDPDQQRFVRHRAAKAMTRYRRPYKD